MVRTPRGPKGGKRPAEVIGKATAHRRYRLVDQTPSEHRMLKGQQMRGAITA
jgi:hypothetical protein